MIFVSCFLIQSACHPTYALCVAPFMAYITQDVSRGSAPAYEKDLLLLLMAMRFCSFL